MISLRTVILVGAVLVSIIAAVAGAPPESPWTPPANADDILRHRMQEEIRSRLETTVRRGRSTFQEKVTELGKKLYDSGVTPADLQCLVDEVIKRNGMMNMTVNYQEDLAAVVEAAAGDLLNGKDLGTMKEYVRKDLVQKMMIEVAIKGMEKVAHSVVVTELDKEQVIAKAHEAAKQRYREAIERAQAERRPIPNPNDLWKKTQQEEFVKAARDWMLKTLQENWGLQLMPRSAGHDAVDKKVGSRINNWKDQGLKPKGSDEDLTSFIEEEVRDIIAKMRPKGGEKEIKEQLEELFERIRGAGMNVSRQDESKMVSKVKNEMGVNRPEEPVTVANQPPLPQPPTPQQGTIRTGSSRSGNDSSGGRASGRTPSATSPQVEPFQCQFLIELKMKNQETSDAVITVHLCKQGSELGTSFEREGVMPPKEIRVMGFSIRDISEAATAIQRVLESENGMNLCADAAQSLGIAANKKENETKGEVPPVRLNCYLRMRDGVFGPRWSDAVKMGVENTGRNTNWKNVSIQFAGNL